MSSLMWDILGRVNKWWIDPKRIVEDDHVSRFMKSTVRWCPNVFGVDDIADGVYTLRGPRQVGKTTMLKLFIKQLLESGFDPHSIVYVPCDILEDYSELLRHLIDIRRRVSGRILIILDEVTFVREWQRAVKVFVDQGLLKDTTIIACGSHAVDVKEGASYLVGRRGHARHPIDRELLTMKFRDYVAVTNPELVKKIKTLDDVVSMSSLKREAFIEEIFEIFMKYLVTGGFPRVIDEYNRRGMVSRETFSDFTNYLSRDIAKLGKSENTARALMASIIKQRCNPTSWNSIAREIGISQPVAQEYGDFLSRMYIIRLTYHPNRTFTGRDERKDKKLILRDPFLYHVASVWIRGFPEISINPQETLIQNLDAEQQHIVEMIVIEHIARHYVTYYWRREKEIDAIIIRNGNVMGFEVKWKERISRSEIREAIRTYNKIPLNRRKLIIVTKNTFDDRGNVMLVPAPLLLIIEDLFS